MGSLVRKVLQYPLRIVHDGARGGGGLYNYSEIYDKKEAPWSDNEPFLLKVKGLYVAAFASNVTFTYKYNIFEQDVK